MAAGSLPLRSEAMQVASRVVLRPVQQLYILELSLVIGLYYAYSSTRNSKHSSQLPMDCIENIVENSDVIPASVDVDARDYQGLLM